MFRILFHFRFDKRRHAAAIDENQAEFRPRLVLRARDKDESSRYGKNIF